MGNGPIYKENAILPADLRASGQNEAIDRIRNNISI
jgi:hypothetical protein